MVGHAKCIHSFNVSVYNKMATSYMKGMLKRFLIRKWDTAEQLWHYCLAQAFPFAIVLMKQDQAV